MMELSGKTIALIVEQQYQELEVWYPLLRLREAGATVIVVGPKGGETYASKLGYPCKTDRSAADVQASQFDGLIIPGGFAPDYMRRSEALMKLVRDMVATQKPTAAICHGPWVLCSTTALKGRKATCFHSIKDDVINAGANYIDAEVVVDGPIITSRMPDDLPAFCQAFIAALKSK